MSSPQSLPSHLFGRSKEIWGNAHDLKHSITPFPTGRIFYSAIPGTSCLATIIESLRDNKRVRGVSTFSTPHQGRAVSTTRTSTI
jgi:hypothetical protein